ncbi:MAG: hypothetical protein K0B01_09715 [Syntrophobacterales bacterium]|nr:hypothetical protein [Syntrophobacterales bacterium]
MNIVPAVADEFLATDGICSGFSFAPEPGIVGCWAGGLGTPVFVFERKGNGTEQSRSPLADITCQQERADVLADAVIEVGMPSLGLVFEGLPADEDIERRLPFEDGSEFRLKGAGGAETFGGAGFVGSGIIGLPLNPVTQVTVGQLLQSGVVELVVVD